MRIVPFLAALLGAFVAAARAGDVQITVTDMEGRPVPDVVVLVHPATRIAPTPAASPVVIAQENMRFVPFLTIVPVGSTLRFVNRDAYDHHVRSMPSGPLGSTPPVTSFELRLEAAESAGAGAADAGRTAASRRKASASWSELKVDQPGPIGLSCHLHTSMRGQVYVSDTPYFAKTDANGVAAIAGVPDGAADLDVWHPDQLQEQVVQHLRITDSPLRLNSQLNFTPRRRRG
jgi:plastocyanin